MSQNLHILQPYIIFWKQQDMIQISIVRCAQICFIFLATMLIVMLSFSLGLTTMHQAYKGGTATQEDGSVLRMKDKFSSVLETLRNLYWSFYGYLGPWEYALAVGNAGPDFKPTNHLFIVIASEVTVAIYHLVVVITLLKMMVTLLIWRGDEVQKDEDTEWKYSRSVIYAEYFDWHTALPPPFNIFFIAAVFIRQLAERCHEIILNYKGNGGPYKDVSKQIVVEEVSYQRLLAKLLRRSLLSDEYACRTAQKVDGEKCLEMLGIGADDG
uniref:Ion transport domain-containing protein n=1 Tax=Parascaris univalens TaxID=6257 RepID=A0A914ZXJ5_PARUN